MVRNLIAWALNTPLIVILLTITLAGLGTYSFIHVNVEAYPDPTPPIIEVLALYPGASAVEVERQVTIPLEVALAGMPGLNVTQSKSVFGLAYLRNQFDYTTPYKDARQEVLNRLAGMNQPLPQGVSPQISPESPTGEIFRYTLRSPKDPSGHDIYTLNDLKALQDWVLEREFRRVPRIVDVSSSGGTTKRYEIHPDPDRLRRYGITLAQLQSALSNSNQNVGGDYLEQGNVALTVRSVGMFGGAEDPVHKVLGTEYRDHPRAAAQRLRAEEDRRLREIRRLVVTSINNQPIRVEDLVEGGRISSGEQDRTEGVTVGHQTRLGQIGAVFRTEPDRPWPEGASLAEIGQDEPEKIQCIVLLRKNEETLPALADVKKKVEELNNPESGKLLPGVQIEPYYDRTELIHFTTETVTENLIVGILLVTVILLMFISNVRTALIVAINIPLALLFAFAVLYVRGKSANLLSMGAVDFGIIVDSSVIMVENIFRHLNTGENVDLPLKERILRACGEVERPLFFSTAVMVCAFIPLFTMQGPEGQIFGPMAQTYAFALGGALVLALTVAPVLCMLFLRKLRPSQDNFLVRYLRRSYLQQLAWVLDHRWVSLSVFLTLILGTGVFILPRIGREFMPELEEGNLWIRGTAPLNVTLARHSTVSREARRIMSTYPEVESIVNQIGRPDDGTDTDGFYNSEYFVPLRPQKDWPAVVTQTGWKSWVFGAKRPRTKPELVKELNEELERRLPGIDWNFSQNIRDNVMEALSGVKGDNSVKIFGPSLEKLQELANKVKKKLETIRGIQNVGIFDIRGQSQLEFCIDKEKCEKWGVTAADINNVIGSALGGKALTTMVEGEKMFDVCVRWPAWRRSSESAILDIPVDIANNQVVQPQGPNVVPSSTGTGQANPYTFGSPANTANPLSSTPRLRLRDLVTPLGEEGEPNPTGDFERGGVARVFREQGNRLIAIKFSVGDGRDLGSAVNEAQAMTKQIVQSPYRMVWSGEFEEMEAAEARLMVVIPLSMVLIFLLLYFAFRSLIDACLVLANVVALSMGGVWALYLTGTNFSISAAVGFISIFGVAIMDGLLLVSYFNRMRALGKPLRETIMEGAGKRVRAMMMTALTAIFGLLPAALSTRIGSQTQQPLAIVVVGGMTMTLLMNRYLMPLLYSFYGHREPPAGASDMAH
jgi:cobalt-zinc-cadmium resistance protein CzcA